MTIDDEIRDEKLQYDINRAAAKISKLSSRKIGKDEYLTGEEILPPDQRRVIEQAKFKYFPLGKAFKKQTKTIEDQEEKQIKALKKSMQKYYLNLMCLLKIKKKVYHLISKNKYSIILLRKELEKLKNYIIVLIFKI